MSKWHDFLYRYYFNHHQTQLIDATRKFWEIIVFVALSVSLLFLEIMQPYYFTQDDNMVQFFPVILDFCRNLEGGTLSTYNPYQFMGAPTLSTGIYALTYPITFVSYLIAKYLLGNSYLTIEVFAFIHILTGYWITKKTAQLLSVRTSIACAGALCFVLSGYSLIAGRSWYYMLPFLFWTPALIFSTLRLLTTPNLKWTILTGLVIGVSFHSGNVQMWVYNLMFVGVIVLTAIVTGNFLLKNSLYFFSAGFLGLALAVPLLVLQYPFSELMPTAFYSNGIRAGVRSMIFPYPIFISDHPNGWGNAYKELAGQFYYSGTVFSAIGLFSILVFMVSFLIFKIKKLPEFLYSNSFLLCGIIAFVLALGNEYKLWPAMSKLPVFHKFTCPFKFLHFVNFFFVVGGGLVLERFFRIHSFKFNWLEYACSSTAILLVAYHVTLCKTSFCTYRFQPYPQLPLSIKNIPLEQGRILSTNPERSASPDYIFCMPHNVPSVYQYASFDGYDNMVNAYQRGTTKIKRKLYPDWGTVYNYGIKHIFAFKESLPSELTQYVRLLYARNDLKIWEVVKTSPLVFEKGNPDVKYSLHFNGSGFLVDISKLEPPHELVVNFCYYSEMKATVNDKEMAIRQDEYGRMVVKVTEKSSLMEIRYVPSVGKGIIAGMVFLVLALFFYFFRILCYWK